MITAHYSLPDIEHAIFQVWNFMEENFHVKSDWISQSEDDLWRELVSCILGSRVRFEVAYAAVEKLEECKLLKARRRKRRFQKYEDDASAALSGAYPFYRVRAKQLREAAERLYGRSESIHDFLKDDLDVRSARRLLIKEIAGIGPKQASLFLRNIGFNRHIAVLDVHVLRYMNWVGLTERLIMSIPTIRKYEKLEDVFIKHACSLGCTPDRFDLAIWTVLKVIREEVKTCGQFL